MKPLFRMPAGTAPPRALGVLCAVFALSLASPAPAESPPTDVLSRLDKRLMRASRVRIATRSGEVQAREVRAGLLIGIAVVAGDRDKAPGDIAGALLFPPTVAGISGAAGAVVGAGIGTSQRKWIPVHSR